LVIFYSKVSRRSPKEKKARPRWEKTEQEGDVVDDDVDEDDESDAVGQERGKKQSKGKEERRKKTEKTPNDSTHSLSPSLHPHNYLFLSTASISPRTSTSSPPSAAAPPRSVAQGTSTTDPAHPTILEEFPPLSPPSIPPE
jgi:hypothetical protein